MKMGIREPIIKESPTHYVCLPTSDTNDTCGGHNGSLHFTSLLFANVKQRWHDPIIAFTHSNALIKVSRNYSKSTLERATRTNLMWSKSHWLGSNRTLAWKCNHRKEESVLPSYVWFTWNTEFGCQLPILVRVVPSSDWEIWP